MKLNTDALQVQSFIIDAPHVVNTTNYTPYSPDCCTDGMSGCDTNEEAGCTHVLGCGPATDADAGVGVR